jgi:hypothetical protein
MARYSSIETGDDRAFDRNSGELKSTNLSNKTCVTAPSEYREMEIKIAGPS